MKEHTFRCDKLIRSHDADCMRAKGLIVKVHALSPHEYIPYLKKKIIEEAHEVSEAQSQAKLLSELVDVYDAVLALLDKLGITREEFERLRQDKQNKKGDYIQGVCLCSMTLREDHPDFNHYQEHFKKES